MKRFLAAVSFLTRVPVPVRVSGADVARGAVFFPLVGALLGGLGAGAAVLLSPILPASVTAIIVVALLALFTGALHLDGVADMADGFGGGRSKDDVLRIMRDHAIGTHGGVALFLLLSAKVVTIAALIELDAAVRPLVVAGALSRWAPTLLGRWLPYARDDGDGVGKPVAERLGWTEFLGATVLAVASALVLLGRRGAVCLGAATLLTACFGLLCRRRIGGVTGDTMGATTEAVELLVCVVSLGLL